MKRVFIYLIACFSIFCGNVSGQLLQKQSYRMQFENAMKAGNMVLAEQVLRDWDYADANDAALYTSYFNYYSRRSMEKDSVNLDLNYAKKALEEITYGITKFPTRFDMRILKIYMCESIKDYKTFTSEITDMINYSKKIDNQWKGEDFTLIKEPQKIFNEAVQEFQEDLFALNDTTLYGNMLTICDAMLKNYPDNVQAMLNKSTVYVLKKDYKSSLAALAGAEKVRPTDPIVLYNIAYVNEMNKDNANAIKYFEKAIQNVKRTDGEYMQKMKKQAQVHIDNLKK